MAQPKPLFIPWLKQQIDSGRYPGVQWVDPEHTRFSIPWKHGLRQDSNSDDKLIFKAWAQTSASSNGQIQGDHSVWKRNFRSALRARGFKMVEDNKNDTANPHKIFLWPDDPQSGASTNGSPVCNSQISLGDTLYLGEDELFPDRSPQPDLLQQCLAGLNIVESHPEMPVDEPVFMRESVELAMNPAINETPLTIQETSNMHHFSPADRAVAGTGQISPADGTLALSQYSPLEGAIIVTQQHTPQAELELELPVQSTSNDSGCNQFETHFMVKIYYRGKEMLKQVVENEAGFRLVFRKDTRLMANPLAVVELPGTESMLDQTQAQSTQEILNNLGGLEVRREGGMLFSYRWGDTRVYWGLDKHEQRPTARPLSKINPEPIYSLKDFVSGMMDFIQNGGKPPSYSLYFFLGQQWPDPRNKPWEKKLIMVEKTCASTTCSDLAPLSMSQVELFIIP
ncbi:interferon regulatory factor 3 isoform X2 [Neoarius graeffei]|uniref:interferon regulatory factor 3 isoform X2 n=1 Tax=Neoarius graeffei TaxID=443677 RepID=UPI00298C619F|nr:interferon regulatory factor 3 isoform X2 [Neoarius graeffei]